VPKRKEHHVVVVVKSTDKYLDVMSRLLRSATEAFGGGCEIHGYDPQKRENELKRATEERNLAVAECHRMRLLIEAETTQVSPKRHPRRRS